MKNKYIIFDLDDTLVYEIDFLKSAYKEIATLLDESRQEKLYQEMLLRYSKRENVFDYLVEQFPEFSKNKLLNIYRNHYPNIRLNDGAKDLLDFLKSKNYKIGLITDGRSITQRNKLKSLNIENIFDKIIVSEEFGSEKPDKRNFTIFLSSEIDDYFYIADNPKKDFIIPNTLKWTSICLLDKGYNIHSQNFDFEENFLPKIKIKSLLEVKSILSK
ncbi:MAG: HAD-IA family hydrolase [Bacteroidetes bacterium]|nr:HAD-IA family hydrolase [Bacteroidota bacterium]